MYDAKRVAASASVPSYAGCVAFGVFMAVVAGLLNTALHGSMSLVAFFAHLGPLALFALTYHVLFWRSAYYLSLVLLAPLLMYSSFGAVDRGAQLDPHCYALTFPTVADLASFGFGALGGLVSGTFSAWTMREARWAALLRPLRTLSMVVLAVIVVATAAVSWRRTSLDDYPASLPVAAELPAHEESKGAVKEPVSILVGPVRVERTCMDPYNRTCRLTMRVEATARVSEEVGCVYEHEAQSVRWDEGRRVWLVHTTTKKDKTGRYAAVRLDPAAPSGLARVELPTSALLSSTRPPFGWFLILVIGAAMAVHAMRRRASAAAVLEAARQGVEGSAEQGWINVPGADQPVRVTNLDATFSGPVVVALPAASASGYRASGRPETASAIARGCTRAELVEAMRRRVLGWELCAVAAVAASLVALGPWLKALARWGV